MTTYYQAVNDCEHCSCGHRHRTKEAARRCVVKLAEKRRIPGSAVTIRKVEN